MRKYIPEIGVGALTVVKFLSPLDSNALGNRCQYCTTYRKCIKKKSTKSSKCDASPPTTRRGGLYVPVIQENALLSTHCLFVYISIERQRLVWPESKLFPNSSPACQCRTGLQAPGRLRTDRSQDRIQTSSRLATLFEICPKQVLPLSPPIDSISAWPELIGHQRLISTVRLPPLTPR